MPNLNIAELASIVSLIGVILTASLGYVRLSKMTPLERATKIKTDVDTQSGIIKDLAAQVDRLQKEMIALREELSGCKKEFNEAKVAWAEIELARKEREKKRR